MSELAHARFIFFAACVPGQGVFFFVVAPFCSCPASLVSRKFCAVGPGCAKCCFFCCAPLGAATFRRGQSKKKTPPRVCFLCFFLLRPRGKAGEGEAPCRHGARAKKKNTTQGVFFFLLRPRRKAREGEAPLGAGTGPEQKKKHHPGCFFLLRPPGKGRGRRSSVGRRHGASPSPHSKKKTPLPACPGLGVGGIQWGVGRPARGRFFFFCCGCAARSFFCCGCAASSLTHLLPAASEHPLQKDIQGLGRVFLLRVRSLTHSLAARRPEHPQQKSTHNKNNTGSNPKPYQQNYKT